MFNSDCNDNGAATEANAAPELDPANNTTSSNPSSSNSSSFRRRVKLYVLNDDRQWDDRGTGYVSSAYIERLTGVCLWVVSEIDGSTLLESRIQQDTAYQKQQETLIVWSEAESLDLALSFQEKEGCEEVWARICWVQGKDPSVDVTQDVAEDEDGSDEFEYTDGPVGAGGLAAVTQLLSRVEMPPCEPSVLAEAARLVTASRTSPAPLSIGHQLAESAIRKDYPRILCCVIFPEAEQQGNVERLQQLQELTTSLLLLNHRRLLESLTMPDDRLLATLGMLEYRPSGRVPHRNFVLGQAANPRQVLKFDRQPGLAETIRRQYRLQYLLDCALPPPSPLDDVQFLTLALRGEGGGGGGGGSSAGFGQQSELSGLVLSGRLRIASDIVQDANLVAELLNGLCSSSSDTVRMLDLARFLRELCCCCPSGQCGLGQLAGLQEQLLNGGRLLEALGCMYTAADQCPAVGAAATDILQCLVDHSAPLLRDHLLHEAADRPDSDLLLSRLVGRMSRDTDPEMSEAHRLACLIRAMLDPDAALTNPAGSLLCPVRSTPVKLEFLRYFYQRVMPRLLQPLLSNTPVDESVEPQNDGGPTNDSYRLAQLQHCILGLALFSAEQHVNHFRGILLTSDLLRHSLCLLRSRHAFLTLSALRFLRRIASAKDELYMRCLVRQRLLDPVVQLLGRHGSRYNMIHSSVLELFEYVLLEDLAPLIVNIVESRYWPDLLQAVAKAPAAVAMCQSMQQRYNQLREKAAKDAGHGAGNNKRPPDSPIVGLRHTSPASGASSPTDRRILKRNSQTTLACQLETTREETDNNDDAIKQDEEEAESKVNQHAADMKRLRLSISNGSDMDCDEDIDDAGAETDAANGNVTK
ncbi:hypothetical protein BOX15_Mlig027300g1 [Macrostomum lignano]|uniref:Uncharacterized protein n=1 Tax=Macrostomum lignano TaxID=282301 RepID=A0A267EBA8_9PLAT|nr:hypothetical protein BOX15_Mlig027300g1 [Macrostomum lignano]